MHYFTSVLHEHLMLGTICVAYFFAHLKRCNC